MATRSTIAIRNKDGTVTGIYCHFDGYFSNNGRMLADNYTTEASVRDLLTLGDLASLGETKELCNAYGRERDGAEAELCGGWNDLLNSFGQEYNYLFVPGDGWYVEYSVEGWERIRGKLVDEMVQETA